MKSKSLKYLLAYIVPAVVLFSIYSENYFSFFSVFFLFVIIPLVELFTNGNTYNFNEIEEEVAKSDKIYDWIIYGLVPLQYLILVYFLIKISADNLSLHYRVGAILSFGMACGILGINAAHELGHRLTRKERMMSKMLLLTTLYMHFYIEHNKGHHKNVSTDNDPASSRLGENVYFFFFRSIWGSWISAWKIESNRLKQKNMPFWSLNNEMLVFQLIQLSLVLAIGLIFGYKTLFSFLIGALVGILLLETVNYIEHYGLRRKIKGGFYERTLPIHSWNSNHPIGRLVLLELSRHSDHHFISTRKYQVLRHFNQSPQMPTGYPGMMVLALIPPLWFQVMNKKVELFKKSLMGEDLA